MISALFFYFFLWRLNRAARQSLGARLFVVVAVVIVVGVVVVAAAKFVVVSIIVLFSLQTRDDMAFLCLW